MSDHTLEDLVDRLERERLAADRAYNDALTALDRAIQSPPALPTALAATERQPPLSVELHQPAAVRFAGLRALIWRVIGPPRDARPALTAALVERTNRSDEANRATREALNVLIDASRREFDALVTFESRLIQYLQTITAYVDTRDRRIDASDLRERLGLAEQRLALLKREVETRPTGHPPQPAAPAAAAPAAAFGGAVESASYVGFEDRFRGSQKEIRRRLDDYLPLFDGCSDVVDIGCGRGELLDLLRARGISARGVDVNEGMVALCRARGLEAQAGDAIGYLQQQPDGSVGGLAAIQVVEHFEPSYLIRFLDVAYLKLHAGAPIVLETINPACWMAFFETYIRDLTHQRPLHPETLKYLVEASGFSKVDVQYRSPVTAGDRLDRLEPAAVGGSSRDIAAVAAVLNAHADKLNARLFSSMDYAVIARR
ncbi:MAG TPA: class I SAM-dependent methyltransferase [Vicinamibacterales bacterium]|nr:class I SAM-dependent methyltransferase [Vicinamibacterales bacterium]